MSKREKIPDYIAKRLYANSRNCCAMPGCNVELVNTANIGQIAHIEGVNPGSARYNPNLTSDEVNSYENLILLCCNHHKLIDSKENLNLYTVEYLKKIKKDHEININESTDFYFKSSSFFIDKINLKKSFIESIKEKGEELSCSLKKKEINENLNIVLEQDKMTRGIMFLILDYYIIKGILNLKHIDKKLQEKNLEIISYLEDLEELNFIEEFKYRGLNAWVEESDGSATNIEKDYTFKLLLGKWQLGDLGYFLFILLNTVGKEEFYNIIVNKEIENITE